MLKQISFLAVLLVLPLTASPQSAAKTFSKSFNSENKGTLSLELPGLIDTKEWDNTYVKIEINVALPSGNTSMLNELANVGRYNMIAKPVDDVLQINMPNLQKQVRIKGEVLKEQFAFSVSIPKGMKLQATNTLNALTASTQ